MLSKVPGLLESVITASWKTFLEIEGIPKTNRSLSSAAGAWKPYRFSLLANALLCADLLKRASKTPEDRGFWQMMDSIQQSSLCLVLEKHENPPWYGRDKAAAYKIKDVHGLLVEQIIAGNLNPEKIGADYLWPTYFSDPKTFIKTE
jgi:hypothetical protein